MVHALQGNREMSLKERILREMVIDPEVMEIFNKLPTELRTSENLDEIQSRLQGLGRTE